MAAVNKVGYPSGKLCRGWIWHRDMFSMVQDAAGAVSKARGSPAKSGQMKLGDGGEGRGHRGDAGIPIHMGSPVRDRVPKGDAEGSGVQGTTNPSNGGGGLHV